MELILSLCDSASQQWFGRGEGGEGIWVAERPSLCHLGGGQEEGEGEGKGNRGGILEFGKDSK